MSFDAHANGATSTVATPPSPANSGVTLSLKAGDGAKFTAAPPFNCTIVNPTGEKEIVRVTSISSDTVTMIRGSETIAGSNTPISIVSGATFTQSITTKTLTDIEGLLTSLTANLPKVPSSLGVVNTGGVATIPYFQSVGIKSVRIGGVVSYPWSPSAAASTRNLAMTYKAAGFFVQYDVVDSSEPHPITATNFSQIQSVCVAEAMYCQQLGFIPDIFGCGNELENYIDTTTLTQSSLYTALQGVAAAVKAAGYTGKLCYNHNQAGDGNWSNGGVGNFDAFAFHPYGNVTSAVVPLPSNQTLNSGTWVAIGPNSSYQYTLCFNGSSTNVVLTGSGFSTLTDFTWCGWIKTDAASKGAIWSNNYTFAGNLGQTIFVSSTGTNIQLSQGASSVSTGNVLTLGTWSFLTITQAGSTVNIYINGVAVVTNATLAQVGQDSQNLTVLGYETDSGSFFTGGMVNVGVWSRALTSTELSGLMVGTYPSSGLIGQFLMPSGTITPAVNDPSSTNSIISNYFAKLGGKAFVSEFNLSTSYTANMSLTPAQQQAGIQEMFNYIQGFYNTYNVPYPMFYYDWNATSYSPASFYGPGFGLMWLTGQQSPIFKYFLGQSVT